MWQAYLTVIRKKASQAIHVLDRFHVMQLIGKAINQVRTEEVTQPKKDGYEPILKRGRWLLLKPENLTEWCKRAMKSKLGPMKKVAKTFRAKRELPTRPAGLLCSKAMRKLANPTLMAHAAADCCYNCANRVRREWD